MGRREAWICSETRGVVFSCGRHKCSGNRGALGTSCSFLGHFLSPEVLQLSCTFNSMLKQTRGDITGNIFHGMAAGVQNQLSGEIYLDSLLQVDGAVEDLLQCWSVDLAMIELGDYSSTPNSC